MPLDLLNNGAPFGEQRTKINEAVTKVNEIDAATGTAAAYDAGQADDQIPTGADVTAKIDLNKNEFATVAEAVAAVTANPTMYTQVRIQERANSWWDVVTGETADGYGIIAAGSKQLKKLPSNPDVQSTVSSSDIVTVLTNQTRINAEKNQRGVIVDADIVSDSGLQRIEKLSDSELLGDYDTDLYGVLRGYKNNGQSPVFTGIDAGVKPRHLKRMSSVDEPRIVFFGSSSFTYTADVINKFASVPAIIQKKIQADNNHKEFVFVNRAISGTSFYDADTIPSVTKPDWYTDPALPWMDYIEAASPDVVIIGFGANDRENLDPGRLKSVVNKINAFAKKPDIVFYTHFVSSLEYSGSGNEANQEGSDLAAGYIRSFAKYYDYGLIDCNRVANMARDGFDPCRLIWKRHEIKFNPGLKKYFGPMCHGWMTRILIEGSTPAEVLNKYTQEDMYFSIGRRKNGGVDKVLLVESPVTPRTIRAIVYQSSGDGKIYETGIPIPDDTHWLEFAVHDNMLYFGIFGQNTWIWQQKILRRYGMFPIEMGYSSISDISPASQLVVNVGVPVTSRKQITGKEQFGAQPVTGGTKLPYGGNAGTHMSHIGIERIVGAAVDSINFTASAPTHVVFGLTSNQDVVAAGGNKRLGFDLKIEGYDGIENFYTGVAGAFISKKTGLATISFSIAVAPEAVGTKPILAELQLNGAAVLDARENPNGSNAYINGTTSLYIEEGDRLSIFTGRSSDDYVIIADRTRLSIMFSE